MSGLRRLEKLKRKLSRLGKDGNKRGDTRSETVLGPRRLEELKRKMSTLGKTGKEGKERDALAEKRKRYKAALAEVHTPPRDQTYLVACMSADDCVSWPLWWRCMCHFPV